MNANMYRTRKVGLVLDEIKTVIRDMSQHGKQIRSVLFDDDTWNVGKERVLEFCAGLKMIGLPWSMMGRADILQQDVYDKMVDAGCRGMRFGVETFCQDSLDSINKRMDAKKNYENLKYLMGRFSGLEFHFTTMRRLPFSTSKTVSEDDKMLSELRSIGESKGNRIHWQTSNCIAYPGTELHDWMIRSYSREFDFSDERLYASGSVEYDSFSKKWMEGYHG